MSSQFHSHQILEMKIYFLHKAQQQFEASRKRFHFVIRHGERVDKVLGSVELNKPNSYLTPKGHTQATETGQFIKSELKRIA